jgi:hypothetical protein
VTLTVAKRAIAVVYPNGGEFLLLGAVHDITWTTNITNTGKIEYSTDGGTTWNPIAGAAAVDLTAGTFAWNTNGYVGGNEYRIRITGNAPNDDVSGRSAANFTLDDLPHELTISLNPPEMKFLADTDEVTDEQTFQLWNSGGGTMPYTVTANKGWILLSGETDGTSTNNEKRTVNVACDSTGLAPGTHTGVITIQDTEEPEVRKEISVEFTVAVPAIGLSTDTIVVNMQEGDATISTFDLWNSGFGTLNYSISLSYDNPLQKDWIAKVDPSAGALEAGVENAQTIGVTYDFSMQEAGTYKATLLIKDTVLENVAPKTVKITVNYTKLVVKGGLLVQLTGDKVTRQAGNKVSFWQDLSGNKNDAGQANATLQPTYLAAAINGKPGLQFNKTSMLEISGINYGGTGGDARTIILVFKTGVDVLNRQVIFAQGDKTHGMNIYVEGGMVYAGAWNLLTANWGPIYTSGEVLAGEDYSIFLMLDPENGQLYGTLNNVALPVMSGVGEPVVIPTDSLTLGNFKGSTQASGKGKTIGLDGGYICEFIYYDTLLNAADLKKIEDYLENRYQFQENNFPVPTTDLGFWVRSDIGLDQTNGLIKGWKSKAATDSKKAPMLKASKNAMPFFVDESINLNPAVRFNGFSTVMTSKNDPAVNSDKAGYPQRTIFAVFKAGQNVNSRQMIWTEGDKKAGINLYIENGKLVVGAWDTKSGWLQFVDGGEIAVGQAYCVQVALDSDANTVSGAVNGISIGDKGSVRALPKHGPGAMGAVARTSIDANGQILTKKASPAYLDADVAELLIYNTILSAEDMTAINKYFNNRYGIVFP